MTTPPPPPDLQPGVPAAAATSSFAGIPFSWAPNGPQWEKKDGLEHYSGEIVMYSPPHVSSLAAKYRPVTITQTGDGMNVYVDYWGSDPTGTLIVLGQTVSDKAILMGFSQGQYQFRVADYWMTAPTLNDPGVVLPAQTLGIARCRVDFIVTDPAAEMTGGGGTGGGDGGISGGGGTVVGTQTFIFARSDTANAQALSLWNGIENAPEPGPATGEADWFTTDYDSGWWPTAVTAFTDGGDYFSGTQPIWNQEGVDVGQQVLFRHMFGMPAGTIETAELDVLVSGCDITVYVNATSVATGISPTSPGWAIAVRDILNPDSPNLIAISAVATDTVAYVSYKIVTVMSGAAPP